jgi:cell division protein FtsQ
MDGGGRLLRSLGEAGTGFFPDPRPRFTSPFALLAGSPRPAPQVSRPRRRSRPATEARNLPVPGLGALLALALLAGTGLYGAYRGGEYQSFVAANGAPADIAFKALGFQIKAVTISGLKSLTTAEILRDGDIGPRNSLLMLDATALRDRLKANPLVLDVSVRKLFPSDLHINVQERDAVALWQKDGQLSLIAADGVPIDKVRDDRFNGLPFVVGDGANDRLGEFQALLAAAGDLRDKVKAGVLVGQRRWTLHMDNGVEVELPELDAIGTLKRLADIERQSRILEKDVVSIDLRIPGRVTARLTEDAAAQRAEMLAKRPKAKAGPA